MKEIVKPAALVVTVQLSLNDHAARVRRATSHAIEMGRKSLEAYRDAGVALIAARAAVDKDGKHNWLAWLKQNGEVSERQARRYMELAKFWDLLGDVSAFEADTGLGEALKLIDERKPKEDRKSVTPLAAPVAQTPPDEDEEDEDGDDNPVIQPPPATASSQVVSTAADSPLPRSAPPAAPKQEKQPEPTPASKEADADLPKLPSSPPPELDERKKHFDEVRFRHAMAWMLHEADALGSRPLDNLRHMIDVWLGVNAGLIREKRKT